MDFYSKFRYVERVFVASNEHAAEIIGLSGNKVKKISRETQTFINCPSPLQIPIFEIYGNCKNSIIFAKKIIQSNADHFDEMRRKKRRICLESDDEKVATIVFSKNDIPFIIGKKGRQVKKIMKIAQVKIISPDTNKFPKIFIITGQMKNIEMCVFWMKLSVFVAIGKDLQYFTLNEKQLLYKYTLGIIDEFFIKIDEIINVITFKERLKHIHLSNINIAKVENNIKDSKKIWKCWRCRENCERVAFALCGHKISCDKCICVLFSDIYLRCFYLDCNNKIDSFIIQNL
ncbi:hypothetical protein PVAND_007724 [Polypedilum vanderplanki]|uniref:K Homology domain-containing protein n=1 Tax=Polypedilum vanderplanki TaxID=319348 RepID=A0A9J6C7U3_POLVA|nr:hypothetical protein PVAND_007724 [Polypedilum vanderplanki]